MKILSIRMMILAGIMLASIVLAEQQPEQALVSLPAGPPPLPQPLQVAYYVAEGTQKTGPFPIDELKRRIEAGTLTRETLVWKQEMQSWTKAGDVAELIPLFVSTPPAIGLHQALDERMKTFVSGMWESKGSAPGSSGMVEVAIKITFRPDGTYVGTQATSYSSQFNNPLIIPLSGTWKVAGLSESQYALTYKAQDDFMERSKPYTIIDPNTVRNDSDGVISRRAR